MIQTATYIPEAHSIKETGGSERTIPCSRELFQPTEKEELIEEIDYFVWRFSDNSELVIGFEKPLVTLSQ